jgi:CPA2 family monovalent cation:H+ antiporter-2
MPHHFFDIAVIILLASLVAVGFSKFRQLPMIGYVMAGVIIGPYFLQIIKSEAEIRFLAEMGVVLLLFILGMELPLKSFRESYKVAILATFLLIALSIAGIFIIGSFIEMTIPEKIVYGFIVSLSSTAVAVKLLENIGLINKGTGQIAISVLIAQDILFVPMIITVNAFGSKSGFNFWFIPKILFAIAGLIALIAYLSKKEKVHLLFEATVEKHKELIPVAALAWCFVGAGISEYIGLSPAYGAFLAGMVIGNSYSKDKVLPRIEPMQSVLLMVFFLSIGMLIDFKVIAGNFFLILLLLIGTMFFKTVICISLLKIFLPNDRWRCSFVTGLTLSQIGEFSFILAAAALSNGIFNEESYKIVIAVIALSLSLSPLWVTVLKKFVQISYIENSAQVMSEAIKQLIPRKIQKTEPT